MNVTKYIDDTQTVKALNQFIEINDIDKLTYTASMLAEFALYLEKERLKVNTLRDKRPPKVVIDDPVKPSVKEIPEPPTMAEALRILEQEKEESFTLRETWPFDIKAVPCSFGRTRSLGYPDPDGSLADKHKAFIDKELIKAFRTE